ncbi:MAG: NUDIX hydrolase [Gammaproteobacteria bacterium]|nr:NUDIX hydrolase [Gammaproteobacteria bacterium]
MPDKNPWKPVSSQRMYENPWIVVEEDQVINPAGNQVTYGKVLFNNVAVAVIALDEEDNTWLVGQTRYVPDVYSWEIPTGGSPIGEDLLTTAKRELQEETGLSAQTWTPLLHLHTSNSVTDEEAYVYIARDLTIGTPAFEDSEDITIKKIPLQQAVHMATEGQITDAISVAALFRISLFSRVK